ncbi:MAG: GDSL-type esterase/lipase family protein [Thermoflexibacter sp.]|jgi:hypothetical protein|nr:GDSL-type esterase/lipase family protein [Thermoflexibacter sp.]
MKLILFCLFGFLFLAKTIDYQIINKESQTIAPTHEAVQYTGRFDFSNRNLPKFAWTGSCITLVFEGTFCHLLINQLPEEDGNSRTNFFNVFIDNQLTSVLKVEIGTKTYLLAKNLPKGIHTISIFKRTEASMGICEFIGFQIDKKGKVLAPTAKTSKKIEFIGDSITCGYGNEGASQSCSFTPETENGYLSYAAIMARNVNAELVTVCYSGKGLIQNYDKSKQKTMPELYGLICPQIDKKWNFSSWKPDIVCINLGTNDFAHAIPDSSVFVRAYISFIDRITINYPDVSIFCLAGSMLNGNSLKIMKSYLSAVVDYQNKKGNHKIYFFEMSTQGKRGYGCDWHPNVAQHQTNAEELSLFVKDKMKW